MALARRPARVHGPCDAFLAAVRDGRVLSARDALATHALCERVVTAVAAAPD